MFDGRDLDVLMAKVPSTTGRVMADADLLPLLVSSHRECHAALLKYGEHQPGCLWHERNDNSECDCGWTALRAAKGGE